MNKPLISVIMSAYNAEKTITDSIDSILFQTYNNFEFIIINDGSTDNTLDILNGYNDKRIKVINQKNIGLTKSLNKGILISKGDFIARQDADEISYPERLKTQIKYFIKNINLVLCGTRALVIENNNSQPTKKINNKNLFNQLITENIFIHGSMMIKKNIFLKFNLYDEKYIVTQDYDAWLRLLDNTKYVGIVLDKILIERKIYNNSVSKKLFINQALNSFKIRARYLNILINIYLLIRHLLISSANPNFIIFLKKIFKKK